MTIFAHLSPASIIRAILIPLLSTAILFPKLYQPLVDQTWHTLRSTGFYNWSTFETIWTVFLYSAIEVSMTVVFMRHPEWRFAKGNGPRSKPRGMRRPSRRIKEIVTYIAPLLAMDLTMIKKFAGVPLPDMLETGNYDTAGFTNSSSGLWIAPQSTFLVPTLHNFTVSSPLQTMRALPTQAPSSSRVVTELIVSLLIYDATFFLFHLSLHIIPPLRRWHAPHHSHDAQLNPQVTNQLSVFERLGLVMLANFSLNIIGAHVLTRTLFVPLFVWLLVEIHSGMDLPWGYDKIIPARWGGGARKHMRHHVGGETGLEPFFNWCDEGWSWVARSSRQSSKLS